MMRIPDAQVTADILACLEEEKGARVSIKHLVRRLGFTSDQRRRVRRLLKALVNEGRVVSEGRGRYRLAGKQSTIEGTMERRTRGWLFILPDDGAEGLRVRPDDTGGALPGDRVRAVVVRRRARRPAEARVEEIIDRGEIPIVGTIRHKGRYTLLEADDASLGPVQLDRKETAQIEDGIVAAVKVSDPAARARPRGTVLEILGEPGCLSTELRRLIVEHGLEGGFSEEVESEAEAAAAGTRTGERADLRKIPFVTIDPPDAKDFDDAVFVEPAGQGWRLLVSIADVAAFVPRDSAIDLAARERGCSVYLPGKVYPMLPVSLSEELCSLAPGEDRHAVTVELSIKSDGSTSDAAFYRSLIRSSARLDYGTVQKLLDEPEEEGLANPQAAHLRKMAECARSMSKALSGRGALDMDLSESEIQLDENGEPCRVSPAKRYFSQRIIEVFMVAANEAVARLLSTAGAPAIYRVHPPPDPDKLQSLEPVSNALGVPIATRVFSSPARLNEYLHGLDGKAVKEIISRLLLRTLMQASYSAECDGHYGLASDAYLHFTSPIRRYPDLAVHQQLGRMFDDSKGRTLRLSEGCKTGQSLAFDGAQAAGMAEQSSRSERKALAAERAAISLYQAAFMQDKVGGEFEGTTSYVADFGVFVEIHPFGVEGMVHISEMRDDYFRYNEERLTLQGRRSGKTISMGQKVSVRVDSVALCPPQVDLVFT